MGTSSGGRGGSGSGMRTGGGGAGTYVSSGGTIAAKPFRDADIKREVGEKLNSLFARASTYTQEMFCNSYLKGIYGELFSISGWLRDIDAVEAIHSEYRVPMDEPGFIFELMERIDEKYKQPGVDARCTNAVRQSLEDFLFGAVSDDPDLSIDGTGREVVTAMREHEEFWSRLSSQFLSTLANTMYEMDSERKDRGATLSVRAEVERRVNRVIKSFEAIYDDGKADYGHLLDYIGRNWDWFKKEMTK